MVQDGKKKRRAKAEQEKFGVTVEVPQSSTIKVSDLKNLTDQEVKELLAKAKKSKVGYIILNAPFKVEQVEPGS